MGRRFEARFQAFAQSDRFGHDIVGAYFQRPLPAGVDQRTFRQIVQDTSLGQAEQDRQPFEAGEFRIVEVSGADVVGVVFGQFVEIVFERLLRNRNLAPRQHLNVVESSGRPLVADVELADGVDFAAEEFDAHRSFGAGREEIDQSPALGEVADFLDQGDAAEAESQEAADEIVRIGFGADVKIDPAVAQSRDRNGRFHQGADRADRHRDAAVGKPRQGRNTPSHDLADRGAKIVRKNLSGGIVADA